MVGRKGAKGRGLTPLCVVLECGVEDGRADPNACDAEIGEVSQDGIFMVCVGLDTMVCIED